MRQNDFTRQLSWFFLMDLQPTVKCSNIKVLYVRTSKIGLVSLYCDSSAWIRDGGIQNIRSMQRHKPHFALTKQRSFSGQKVFFPQTDKTLNIQNCLVLNHEQWMCNHHTWKQYARVSKVQRAMYKKKERDPLRFSHLSSHVWPYSKPLYLV